MIRIKILLYSVSGDACPRAGLELLTPPKEFAYMAMKDDGWHPLNAADDSLFQNFVNATEQTNIGKFREVRMAIEQNDLALAETKNSSIVTGNIIEENRKNVNDIYLITLAVEKTEFDIAQTLTLQSIACQDPLEGGDAVYSARVMLRTNDVCGSTARMAGSSNDFAEKEIFPIIKDIEEVFAEIYPNPNSGEFVINYKLDSKKMGELMILDVNGKILYKQILPQNKQQIEINSLELSTGIYFYRVLINDISVLNKKLVVIR